MIDIHNNYLSISENIVNFKITKYIFHKRYMRDIHKNCHISLTHTKIKK